jgi:hypothetical protein
MRPLAPLVKEEEVDEDLQESFTKERKLTLEMFQRMSKFL